MQSDVTLSPGDHVVHFYRSEADLAEVVAASLAAVLQRSEPVIVIAVPGHRAAFAAGLVALDIDLAEAETAGTLVWRDAEQVAAQLLHDHRIDAETFEATLASLVRDTAAGGGRVHAYGEIVSVLWAAGDVVAAMELESLWNDLIAETSISLLCGYPADIVAVDNGLVGYADVCGQHGRRTGAAPVPAEAEVVGRYPGTAAYVRHARQLVVDTLNTWGQDALVDQATLVISEMASNAILHGGPEFSVALLRDGALVRLYVGDSDGRPPRPRASTEDQPGGRGLLLIDALSSSWGHDIVSGGKLVWADLSASPVEAGC